MLLKFFEKLILKDLGSPFPIGRRGSPIDRRILIRQEEMIEDIRSHLNFLLLCRQGSHKHLPDYGLPDITQVYQNLPDSINDFIKAIQTTITRYEPRLNDVTVQFKPETEEDCVISVQILGKLVSDCANDVQFRGLFTSGGGVNIRNA